MIYFEREFPGAVAEIALFPKHRSECHVMIHSTLKDESFSSQFSSVEHALEKLSEELLLKPIFLRFFLSDIENQAQLLKHNAECASSFIQQAPLDGSKIAIWAVLEQDSHYSYLGAGVWKDSRGIIWQGDNPCELDSEAATISYLEKLSDVLNQNGGSLLDNCIRTWFLVRDVDRNYKGVVRGRNEVFAHNNLCSHTHFISSTGIGGQPAGEKAIVAFNAIADLRLIPGQMHFLKAESHMNPTIDYGVAFERGTCVDYCDRRHVYISGTASIDNKGQIVHKGDVKAQTLRMIENIEVLLTEAECSRQNLAHIIVYLRDIADYHIVAAIFRQKLPSIPKVIVYAPVCRPGWLIEAECMAITDITAPDYAEY